MSSRPSEPVSFRLPHPLVRELEQRAQVEGQSRHEVAKEIVTEHLLSGPSESLEKQVGELGRDLARLRVDFATAVQVILVKAAGVQLSVAREWVDENFFGDD